ncbi:hypothetical protein MMC12_000675 [Toensbergia leucococca]|nr:hypothetical protein [Toensbergia leucococca]
MAGRTPTSTVTTRSASRREQAEWRTTRSGNQLPPITPTPSRRRRNRPASARNAASTGVEASPHNALVPSRRRRIPVSARNAASTGAEASPPDALEHSSPQGDPAPAVALASPVPSPVRSPAQDTEMLTEEAGTARSPPQVVSPPRPTEMPTENPEADDIPQVEESIVDYFPEAEAEEPDDVFACPVLDNRFLFDSQNPALTRLGDERRHSPPPWPQLGSVHPLNRARCTEPTCPVEEPHSEGLYLHDGNPNATHTHEFGDPLPFGLSNPPPAVWAAYDRDLLSLGTPHDNYVWRCFVYHHC